MYKCILLIISISFIFAGSMATYLTVNEYIFMKDFSQNSAQISAIVTDSIKKVSSNSDGNQTINYDTHVQFSVNSIEYYTNCNLSNYKAVGSSVMVYYYLDDPNVIRVDPNPSIWWVLFSLIFLIIGLIILVRMFIQMLEIIILKTMGTTIFATITNVGTDYSVRVNGACVTKLLECSYREPTDGNTYIFKKGSLSLGNISESSFIGKEVEVYVNPTNFNKYFINHKNIR